MKRQGSRGGETEQQWLDHARHGLPDDLVGRLAALAPPPRLHLIRYHGVLPTHAADRALIVPAPPAAPPAPHDLLDGGL